MSFFCFCEKLCELLNKELSPETEAVALKLFDEIYAELIDNSKQPIAKIGSEMTLWQQQDFGPSKVGSKK